MATVRHNEEFTRTLLPTSPLDNAIEWIKSNLAPDDVFDEEELYHWARDNARSPEDVFRTADLAEWAEASGYAKE